MSGKGQSVVEQWLAVIRLAIDPKSPFAGQVDLSRIFDLSHADQCLIYEALSGVEKFRLKELYGKKGAGA